MRDTERDEPGTLAPYAKAMRLSLLFGSLYGFVVGAAQASQSGFGLTRFGGVEYIPRVVVLSLLRELAPWAALVATCMTTTVVVHRAARRAVGGAVIRDRRPYLLGAAVMILSVTNVPLGLLGATFVSVSMFSLNVSAFARNALESILVSDAAVGAAVSVAYAIIVTALAALAAPKIATTARGLFLKLVATFVVLQLVALAKAATLAGLYAMLG